MAFGGLLFFQYVAWMSHLFLLAKKKLCLFLLFVLYFNQMMLIYQTRILTDFKFQQLNITIEIKLTDFLTHDSSFCKDLFCGYN